MRQILNNYYFQSNFSISTEFQEDNIHSFAQVMKCDQELFKRFFHGMLEEGVYLAPSAFEAGFVSGAHTDEDIAATIAAAGRVLNQL